jgi:hypothetical protein
VVSGSTLEVVRDGSPIAKLLVSAVERNTASASIVPDSVAQDTVLMVGDEVVAAHKPAAEPAKASESGPLPTVPEPGTEPDADAMPSLEADLGADPLAEPAAPEPSVEPAAEADLEISATSSTESP